MTFSSVSDLEKEVSCLRERLEVAFGPDTACGEHAGNTPSSGQCAAVAAIVFAHLGGQLVSARVKAHSHWFNRVAAGSDLFDVDITGDQFGLPAVQIAPEGLLYDAVRLRQPDELDVGTRARAALLVKRAGLETPEGR